VELHRPNPLHPTPGIGARRRSAGLLLAAAVALLGSLVHPTAASAKDPKIAKATFAKSVTSDFEAKGVTTKFYGSDTVFLLLRFNGRPKSGKIESVWSFRGEEIGRATVDMASEDTFVKFNFTPAKDNPLPNGTSYAVKVNVNGKAAGTYPFQIIPPASALPSKVAKAFLSNAKDGAAVTTFKATDTVYLDFVGDFGVTTWLEAQWTVNGKVDPKGTRSITLNEDAKATPGNFSFLPAGGWPKGKQSVSLYMNDVKVGSYSFTVA
jgi:hypothetical protein